MLGQTAHHPDHLTSTVPRPAVSAAVPGVQLGPPQRIQLPNFLRLIRRGSPVVVPPTSPTLKPLWHEKGWRHAPNAHAIAGWYVAGGQKWRRLIEEPYPKGYAAYIWQPPLAGIRSYTSHGPCFAPSGETGRFRILFHSTPTSLDHVITSVETVLTQACTGTGS